MQNKQDAVEAAWQKQGITMFRPPTPKELREVFDSAFEAGYDAALRSQWVRIEDKLPTKDRRYFVRVKENFGRAYGAYYWPLHKSWDIDVGYGFTVIAWMPIPKFQEETE